MRYSPRFPAEVRDQQSVICGVLGGVEGKGGVQVTPFVRHPARGHSTHVNLGENNEQMLSELGKKYWVPPTRAPFGRGRLVATWRSWHEAR